jgi:choline dehydrogenase-like flavoprotein
MFAMSHALSTTRDILEKCRSKQGFWIIDLLPGWLFNFIRRPEDAISYIQNYFSTYYHPCGTCKMGEISSNTDVVVNDALEVATVKGIRIADASIIPHIPNVPISKLCMIIGAMAAEKIIASSNRD